MPKIANARPAAKDGTVPGKDGKPLDTLSRGRLQFYDGTLFFELAAQREAK